MAILLLGVLHELPQLLDALQTFLLVMIVVQAAQVQTHLLRHSYEVDLVLTIIIPGTDSIAFFFR